MIATWITGIICLTVVILTLINRYWTWKFENPYTEDIIDQGTIINYENTIIGRWYTIKKVYKNGKILITRKQFQQ